MKRSRSLLTLDKGPARYTYQGTYGSVEYWRQETPEQTVQKDLDGLYEVLAPGSVVQKTDQYTSVFREIGKLEVSVRNSDIPKFGNRGERKTKLTEYINQREPKNYEKSAEAKILSHISEFTRIQKGDREMKHRKRDTASAISSNGSNFARAMRGRMPKVPPNIAPPETLFEPEATSAPQDTASQLIIAPPPTNQSTEFMISSTSAPLEALHQVLPRKTKRARKSPK